MEQIRVQFNSIEDIQQFVKLANQVDGDIDLKIGSRIVDAKSLLGALAIGSGKKVDVILHGQDEEFKQKIGFCKVEKLC